MSLRPRHAALPLIAALALAGCTSAPKPAAPSTSTTAVTTTTTTTTTTAPPKPQPLVTVSGATPALTAVVTKLYVGRGKVAAKASVGRWKGQPVAVVTAGEDVTLAVAAPKWTVVGGWWPSMNKPTPRLGGKRFVMALGSDARVKKGQSITRSRADALQVIGQDGRGGGGLLGLARDLWVPMPGGGSGKLNSVMVAGGPAAQTKAVARLTGIGVSDYIVMSFEQVTTFVNQMGGLPIVIPKAIHGTGTVIDLKPGPQVLTGAQVLGYARERKSLPDGDFGRSRHQGDLLLAAAIKARLAGVSAVPGALTTLDRLATSNMSAARMLTFVAGFYALSPAKVGKRVAKGGFGTSPDGQSIVLLDQASKRAFVDFRDGRIGG